MSEGIDWEHCTRPSNHKVTEPGNASSPQFLGKPVLIDDTVSTKSGKRGYMQLCNIRTAIIVKKQASLNYTVPNKSNNIIKRNKALCKGQSWLNFTSSIYSLATSWENVVGSN